MKKGIEYSLDPDGEGKYTLSLVLGQLPSEAGGKLVGAAIARTLATFGVNHLRDAMAAEDPESVKVTPYELARIIASATAEFEFEETANILAGYIATVISRLPDAYGERCRMVAIERLTEDAPVAQRKERPQ